jgi:hypothetical protein
MDNIPEKADRSQIKFDGTPEGPAGSFGNPIYQRRGPDIVLKMISVLSVVLWGFLIVNFGLVMSAKPELRTFFDRLLHTSVREHWDYSLLELALKISIVQFIFSFFTLYLNSMRLKRKDDTIRLTIVISVFDSLILLILLMFVVF